jgi:hypothetical protein
MSDRVTYIWDLHKITPTEGMIAFVDECDNKIFKDPSAFKKLVKSFKTAGAQMVCFTATPFSGNSK